MKTKSKIAASKRVQLNGAVDQMLARRLKLQLALDGKPFTRWLEEEIKRYTKSLPANLAGEVRQ